MPEPDHFPDAARLYGRRASARWERLAVADLFERLRWSEPDKTAIVAGPGASTLPQFRNVTYRQADLAANRLANALIRLGVGRGDRVLFLCENSVEAFLAKIGVAKAGAVAAPVNPNLGPDVVANLVARLEPAQLIIDADVLERAWPLLGERRADVTVIGTAPASPGPERSFAELLALGTEEEPAVEIHCDDIWQILPTSGTTSMPKLVMQSHLYAYMAALTSALTYTRGIRLEGDLRLFCPFPVIYHASDQAHAFPAFLTGGTLLLGRHNRPDANAALISSERATAMFGGSSSFLREFADHVAANPSRYDLTSLTSITYTWAPIHPEVAATLKRLCGQDLLLTGHLGQTEVLSTTRFWPDRWPEIHKAEALQKNHVGIPNPLLAAAILDETGTVRGPGTPNMVGEIVYRTPAVTAGYYGDSEATGAAFADGWFHSGDCGYFDDNGLLILVDRYKDMIKSGGENVSTIRVEAVLNAHPAVRRSAVVGLPHPRWSEAVTAFVERTHGGEADERAIIAHCRGNLAGFETPKAVIFVEELPKTVGGKVQKQVLRRQYDGYYLDPSRREAGR